MYYVVGNCPVWQIGFSQFFLPDIGFTRSSRQQPAQWHGPQIGIHACAPFARIGRDSASPGCDALATHIAFQEMTVNLAPTPG